MNELSYPIGKFESRTAISDAQRSELIESISVAPTRLRAAIAGLSPQQLDTPYRPDGWTVRQVVHHFADSHLNGYVRFRLALTEAEPTIKPYQEQYWAELDDAKHGDPAVSLALLDALHQRWVTLLHSLDAEDFARTLLHPERGVLTLAQNLQLYEWHGRHHTAHITSLRQRMGWSGNA